MSQTINVLIDYPGNIHHNKIHTFNYDSNASIGALSMAIQTFLSHSSESNKIHVKLACQLENKRRGFIDCVQLVSEFANYKTLIAQVEIL